MEGNCYVHCLLFSVHSRSQHLTGLKASWDYYQGVDTRVVREKGEQGGPSKDRDGMGAGGRNQDGMRARGRN